MSAGLDSMILIYAGVVPSDAKKRPATWEDLRVRSKIRLHQLAKQDEPVLLPTIAVSELLIPVPAADRGALIAAIQEQFVCPPFDLPAAAIAADIWAEHSKLPQDLQYTNRRTLKADALIVASAKSAGATDFFTNDRKCRALAKIVMRVHDLPKYDPDDMFLLDDIKRGDL